MKVALDEQKKKNERKKKQNFKTKKKLLISSKCGKIEKNLHTTSFAHERFVKHGCNRNA